MICFPQNYLKLTITAEVKNINYDENTSFVLLNLTTLFPQTINLNLLYYGKRVTSLSGTHLRAITPRHTATWVQGRNQGGG